MDNEAYFQNGVLDSLGCSSLNDYVDKLMDKYSPPAISLAIWDGQSLHKAASGCLNIETEVNATPDSVFQIGSITKVFTAVVTMQLVDEGRLELDKPVKDYLRDFLVEDAVATEKITIRQLLNHTSGLANGFYPDDPMDGNALKVYVDRCALLPQLFPPGERHSYSNPNYSILGRLIEVVTGVSWDVAVQERIFKPLNLNHSFIHPKHAIRYRSAIGHLPNPSNDDQWSLVSSCYLPWYMAPAGGISMSATDLITFARAFINGGNLSFLDNNSSDTQWVSAQSLQEMKLPSVKLPQK